MPIFGSASPFDKLVEKATDEANTSEDWQLILEICDHINSQQNRLIDCLRSILKRINNPHPNVSIQAVVLLDACVSNCGKKFHLEVASREFELEARKLLAKGHPKVIEKFKFVLRKWSENEFKSDPQLSYMQSFISTLKSEGVEFPSLEPPKIILPKDPNIVISDQEEEDIIKALEASMKDMKTSSSTKQSSSSSSALTNNTQSRNSMYPSLNEPTIFPSTSNQSNNNQVSSHTNFIHNDVSMQLPHVDPSLIHEPFKVRALYDFEAVEENELTFKTGDIITVTDNRDENWWTGSHSYGRGMFPANFVTRLDSNSSNQRSVQFCEEVTVKTFKKDITSIDEQKIDRLLHLIHEADPTGVKQDSLEMLNLEEECAKMAELIEADLERLDKIQVALNTADRTFREALKIYLYMNE